MYVRNRLLASSLNRGRSHIKLNLSNLEDRTVPSLLGNQLFPVDNPWNQKITNAPVAANSASIMNSIISKSGNGRLHPDFSQNFNSGADLYGIPYNVVHGNSTAKTSVVIDAYDSESDLIPAPIPPNPTLEGDYQNGPRVGVDNRGDSHLLIYDVDNNVAYEYYRASRPSENADGKWHADQQTVWDMKANTFRTLGWTSADAAGLSILAGLVRPDEGLPVSQGGQGVINHAIRFTLQNSIILNQFLYPASHTANPGNNSPSVQPPMGARFRLKASVDITSLNPQARIVAQAMKDYGMIVSDNGSNFYFSGASYAVDASNQRVLTWNDDDIQDTQHGLKSLRFADFEVVDLTPVVTSLSANSGQAGAAITINGQNFGGAAGRLQVLFGSTPAKSVTYVDDAHIVAVVPTGSGAVDVRVKSGITTGANSKNNKSPIFGYGLSTITAGGRFTYGSITNPLPPATVTTVTGADAGASPHVRIFDAQTGIQQWDFFAYDTKFRGGVRVASGDVNNDGVADIITSPGPGGGPHIRVWDGKAHQPIRSFMAYVPTFVGGVHIAAGDINGDGFADIVTGADAGGGPHVRVFNGKDGSPLQSFFAYAPTFAGGVRVAAGDVNNDGRADVVTGAGPGGGPHVRVFDGTSPTKVLQSFLAYHAGFLGGVFVAAGDVNGDNHADIVTGAGAGGGPHVKIFNGINLTVMESFFAYGANYTAGVRVGVIRDVNGDGRPDVITTYGPGSSQLAKVFRGSAATFLNGFMAYDPTFQGGVYVGGI